jgi:hypothetical protein
MHTPDDQHIAVVLDFTANLTTEAAIFGIEADTQEYSAARATT